MTRIPCVRRRIQRRPVMRITGILFALGLRHIDSCERNLTPCNVHQPCLWKGQFTLTLRSTAARGWAVARMISPRQAHRCWAVSVPAMPRKVARRRPSMRSAGCSVLNRNDGRRTQMSGHGGVEVLSMLLARDRERDIYNKNSILIPEGKIIYLCLAHASNMDNILQPPMLN